MREILFKAKRIDNGEWVIGHYIPFGLDVDIHYDIDIIFNRGDYIFCSESQQLIEINIKTLCQYTGLKDKNGNKIFENDTLNAWYGSYELTVSWDDENAMFYAEYKGTKSGHEDDDNDDYAEAWDFINYEVIGNKFDSPELLEKGGAS